MARKAPQPAAARRIMNLRTGAIFTWTEALASRPGMVECDADGVSVKPVAERLARRAEAQKLMTETPDTFGAVGLPRVSNADLTAGGME